MQLETLSEYFKEIVDTRSVHTLTRVLRNLEVGNHLCEVYKLAKLIMVMPGTDVRENIQFVKTNQNIFTVHYDTR